MGALVNWKVGIRVYYKETRKLRPRLNGVGCNVRVVNCALKVVKGLPTRNR